MSVPKLIVVDADAAHQNQIRRIANSMPVSCDAYSTAEELLESGMFVAGGVLVSEFRLLGMNGIDLQQKLVELDSPMQIVFHTSYAETWLTVLAMRNGAYTVLDKPAREQELWDAIHSAMRKYHQIALRELESLQIRKSVEELSSRQRQVLHLMIEGMPNKQIAIQLGVSTRTVEACRHDIFEEFNTRSLAELVRMIMQANIDLENV